MNRFINQLNVSITTNRTCTLRCDHCYIAKHLFDDKTQMTQDVFKQIFDQVEALYDLDHNLQEVEWEAIGGETTMMPYEWWEEMLPYALERINRFNERLALPGSLNFLTNLIYSDKRYTDLINRYAHDPAFALYTSWEPDTQRFGKNNKLEKKFLKTLGEIDAPMKILDLILTKELCEMGAERVLDIFIPLGITDFSCKQLSPYGSGKAFFEPNMTGFAEMTQFLQDLARLKPDYVTFTPQDEMQGAIHAGASFQCNGNFKYDLAIEPDGSCTFNASQTADEAALGHTEVHITDPKWPEKVLFENTPEQANKLTLLHDECRDCTYLHTCNAGWYHYKIAEPEKIDRYKNGECSGYKALWDDTARAIPQSHDRTRKLHREALKARAQRERVGTGSVETHQESSLLNREYEAYLDRSYSLAHQTHTGSTPVAVTLSALNAHGKSPLERAFFYDDIGLSVVLNDKNLLNDPDIEKLITAGVHKTFKRASVRPELVLAYAQQQLSSFFVDELDRAMALMDWIKTDNHTVQPASETPRITMDARREELLRWVNEHWSLLASQRPLKSQAFTQQELRYAEGLRARLEREGSL